MDIEEKREYLLKYRILNSRIKRLSFLIEENPENAENYKAKINETKLLRDKIEADIDNVDGGVLSEILAEKYICGKSLEEIAEIIGYCKRQIERLHIKALQKFCTV